MISVGQTEVTRTGPHTRNSLCLSNRETLKFKLYEKIYYFPRSLQKVSVTHLLQADDEVCPTTRFLFDQKPLEKMKCVIQIRQNFSPK